MCGICGFVNLNGRPAEREILNRMNRAMAHRGPDGSGALISGPAAIAMRRLAIIDVDGGRQPISTEDEAAHIVFNGEIYNSPDLSEALRAAGHVFRTHSDTESILHQYEEDGPDCVRKLRGMFAFAILSTRGSERSAIPELFVARDRVGIKPLFYYSSSTLFAFSSEIVSLLQHPSIPREIDEPSLRQYLATGVPASPGTLLRGVKQLLPGHWLRLSERGLVIQRYWMLPGVSGSRASLAETTLQVRSLLENSVYEHLLSDVPVGAFLSGGIDSSTVVALMSRASGGPVPTFSIRFQEQGYDESPFSRLVADRYSTDHHEFVVRNEGFDIDILQAMITHHGQPTADTSAVPTFMVSRLARQFVKVVLSGDGGDECFGGYTHFGWAQDIDRLYAVPRPVRGAGAVLLRRLAHSKLLSQAGALRQGLNSLDVALADRSQVPLEVLRLNDGAAIDAILTPEWCREHDDRPTCLETFLSDLPPGDPVRQSQEFAFRYVLPDAYLAKVDRMSMASALEVRVPFLDHRLVEFCLSLPGHVHWRHGKGKNLLRRAAADLLPPEIFAHRKQGFGIPLHRWANDEYFELAEELLGAESVRRRGVFRPQAVKELLDRAQGRTPSGNALESTYRLSHRLFMLVGFEMWCRLLIDNLVDSPSCTARWESQVDEESSVG